MAAEARALFLANRPLRTPDSIVVHDKFRGTEIARVCRADPPTLQRAIEAAVAAAEPMRRMPAHRRRAVLDHCVARLDERREELAHVLCAEVGKPIRDARGEVARMIDTFRIASEESVRIGGEVIPMDRTPRGDGFLGLSRRVPVGPCAFITPFNFPLNLAAHKVAPALAVGCPFVLKPSSATPLTALLLGEVLAGTDLPPGAFSILPCRAGEAEPLATDDRIALLSFTGSPDVGWSLKSRAGRKKVVLELGGNAAVIVDETAAIDEAVERICFGAFYQAGQSCISVQRIVVHAAVYEAFRDRLVAAASKRKAGDPHDEETFIGPLIDESEAERLEAWIAAAVARGGRVLCGGGRRGAVMEATLLENVPPDADLCAREAFGPVAVLSRFDRFDEALAEVNASRYGLQAGVFTRDVQRALRAWSELEVGGVIVGDVSAWRADHMPYGGVKGSGTGREGVRYAMEEMTDVRLLVVRGA
ncbi:MAG: aldehyde dehydrogenase family protein [Phycisphaerae bacterium]|nr:aldehyde dehydrogenase family protein [Phycisphaerae bacterium]